MAKSLVIICEDPDAPTPKPWIHWLIYNIPAFATQIPADIPPVEKLESPYGAYQGKNSYDTVGYRGPMPPAGQGRHRYFYRIYAVSIEPKLNPGEKKDVVWDAIKDHIVAQGEIMGTYQR